MVGPIKALQRGPGPRAPGSLHISAPCEFLDVVHHGIELELAIDLGFAAQGEATQAFVVAQVAKHGLDGGKSPGDHPLALVAVDALAHELQRIGLIGDHLALHKGDLAGLGFVRGAQALGTPLARQTALREALELDHHVVLDLAWLATAAHALACRADADVGVLVPVEVGGAKQFGLGLLRLLALVVQGAALFLVVILAVVSRIALAVIVVGDEGADAILGEV